MPIMKKYMCKSVDMSLLVKFFITLPDRLRCAWGSSLGKKIFEKLKYENKDFILKKEIVSFPSQIIQRKINIHLKIIFSLLFIIDQMFFGG